MYFQILQKYFLYEHFAIISGKLFVDTQGTFMFGSLALPPARQNLSPWAGGLIPSFGNRQTLSVIAFIL